MRALLLSEYKTLNIGSLTSVMGSAGLGPYGARRGGIRQLTISLADGDSIISPV
jgi:gluconate 5-dehydrogenase